MDQPISTRATRLAALEHALEQRILVLDGAMGTELQARGVRMDGRPGAALPTSTSRSWCVPSTRTTSGPGLRS
jgi:Methionine synthase I (cobalamin-dependent), methyltransferase domain